MRRPTFRSRRARQVAVIARQHRVGGHGSDVSKSASSYADGAPFDRVQYLEAKLILQPDRFRSVESFRDFGKIVRRVTKQTGIGFIEDKKASLSPEIREIIFMDTPDLRSIAMRSFCAGGFHTLMVSLLATQRSCSSSATRMRTRQPPWTCGLKSRANTESSSRRKRCRSRMRSAAIGSSIPIIANSASARPINKTRRPWRRWIEFFRLWQNSGSSAASASSWLMEGLSRKYFSRWENWTSARPYLPNAI